MWLCDCVHAWTFLLPCWLYCCHRHSLLPPPGDFSGAVDTLKTAISLIKQSITATAESSVVSIVLSARQLLSPCSKNLDQLPSLILYSGFSLLQDVEHGSLSLCKRPCDCYLWG